MRRDMRFVIGDHAEGYSVERLSRGPNPWKVKIWLANHVRGRFGFDTAKSAINFCHTRYRTFRGRGLKVRIPRRY